MDLGNTQIPSPQTGPSHGKTQPWSSGRISACHAEDPVSIPGGCNLLPFVTRDPLPCLQQPPPAPGVAPAIPRHVQLLRVSGRVACARHQPVRDALSCVSCGHPSTPPLPAPHPCRRASPGVATQLQAASRHCNWQAAADTSATPLRLSVATGVHEQLALHPSTRPPVLRRASNRRCTRFNGSEHVLLQRGGGSQTCVAGALSPLPMRR